MSWLSWQGCKERPAKLSNRHLSYAFAMLCFPQLILSPSEGALHLLGNRGFQGEDQPCPLHEGRAREREREREKESRSIVAQVTHITTQNGSTEVRGLHVAVAKRMEVLTSSHLSKYRSEVFSSQCIAK